jgi:uncharacterized protein
MTLLTSPATKLAEHVNLSASESAILQEVYDFVRDFFQNPKFDASHDFAHVERVTKNALAIFDIEKDVRSLNPLTILLGALLHDVEDKKYSDHKADETSAIEEVLLSCGIPGEYAEHVKRLVDGVSYSSEVKDPARVQQLIQDIPELAVVQDADRLDAIGAIGVARCFTFGGAKALRSMDDSVQHLKDKLLKLQDMMKTDTGKKMATERSQRLRQFVRWWEDEIGV